MSQSTKNPRRHAGVSTPARADLFADDFDQNAAHPAKPDMLVPMYDRQNATGCYAVAWLIDGTVVFSSRCRDLGQAMRLSRQHKRAPTWILNGLERELDVAQFCLGYRASGWLDSSRMDVAIRKVISVVSTANLPAPSKFVQPAKARPSTSVGSE